MFQFWRGLPDEFHSILHSSMIDQNPSTEVERCLAERMLEQLKQAPTMDPKDLTNHIWTFWHYGERNALKELVHDTTARIPQFAINLVACGCSYRLGTSDPDRRWNWQRDTLESLERLTSLEDLESTIRNHLGDAVAPPKLITDRRDRLEELNVIELAFTFLRAMENRRKDQQSDQNNPGEPLSPTSPLSRSGKSKPAAVLSRGGAVR